MEEKEMQEFSWTTLFCVTAVSFILFSVALNLLDASSSNLFLKIGFVFGGIGILSILNTRVGARMAANKRTVSQQQEDLF